MKDYNLRDWYWIISGDESKYWSSAAMSYVVNLPDNAGVTRIASEEELTDVLRVYGLRGPAYSLTEAKNDLVALLSEIPSNILSNYPEGEPQSWPAKEEEATKASKEVAPIPSDYPLLRDEIAATMDIDKTDVTPSQISTKATSVLSKSLVWRELVSRIAGLRQRYNTALEAAASADERTSIIAAAREEVYYKSN